MPRSRLPLILAIVAVVAVLGGFVTFQQLLAGDDVARLTLPPASTATPDPSATEPGSSTDPSAGADTGSGSATAAELAGTWTVGDGSVVGYRVREQIGGVSALTDAVGRTSAVTGTATLEATGDALTVSAAEFEADLTQLESDESRRDNRIRSIGLQSDEFPTGTFVLTQPIDVPAAALAGETVDITMTGDLTIHGVTKEVSIPGQARLNGDLIEVVGAVTFLFTDFGMTPPDVAGFVQVEDEATLEVLISLARG